MMLMASIRSPALILHLRKVFLRKYSMKPSHGDEIENFNGGPIHVIKTENPQYEKKLPPEAPTSCCQSNCPNCVWVTYAQDMLEFYKDGGERALKIVDKIDDTNLKAFLKMEIKANIQQRKS